ncbi:hypothetical protein LCGC14_1712400 [marine sediment metagenome]|uniref:Uncharacterized protein n=1 Tax=marine sediment metagenome TaxID=412755 RepID=A0A0F9KEU9_9ZZZZ
MTRYHVLLHSDVHSISPATIVEAIDHIAATLLADVIRARFVTIGKYRVVAVEEMNCQGQ